MHIRALLLNPPIRNVCAPEPESLVKIIVMATLTLLDPPVDSEPIHNSHWPIMPRAVSEPFCVLSHSRSLGSPRSLFVYVCWLSVYCFLPDLLLGSGQYTVLEDQQLLLVSAPNTFSTSAHGRDEMAAAPINSHGRWLLVQGGANSKHISRVPAEPKRRATLG
ncbi:hypothetical protein RRG08_037857 [Elysia crispata]|uniref:Uncharacterized protein n=1 Tax=Elysia crispata TaxID=231223 RepID=A0AAE0ZJM9_9GAST|nr:hypothetical protein RRG08_037857 [Elysia crispata]